MIECAFTARLGRKADLRHVQGGTLAIRGFSAAVEDGKLMMLESNALAASCWMNGP